MTGLGPRLGTLLGTLQPKPMYCLVGTRRCYSRASEYGAALVRIDKRQPARTLPARWAAQNAAGVALESTRRSPRRHSTSYPLSSSLDRLKRRTARLKDVSRRLCSHSIAPL